MDTQGRQRTKRRADRLWPGRVCVRRHGNGRVGGGPRGAVVQGLELVCDGQKGTVAEVIGVGLLDGRHSTVGVLCELAPHVATGAFRATRGLCRIALATISNGIAQTKVGACFTLTLRSRQASQLGSFRRCLYARLGLCIIMAEIWEGEGVLRAPLLGRKFSPGRGVA
jgi:hypothetical protein